MHDIYYYFKLSMLDKKAAFIRNTLSSIIIYIYRLYILYNTGQIIIRLVSRWLYRASDY